MHNITINTGYAYSGILIGSSKTGIRTHASAINREDDLFGDNFFRVNFFGIFFLWKPKIIRPRLFGGASWRDAWKICW